MPRVKPLAKRDQREIDILAEIGATQKAMGLSQMALARRANINPSTLSLHLKDIGSMRLRELWAIRDVRQRAGVELRGD